ncbi:MAG: tetratricopeptide repeat protein [Candidatus Aminicenantes bacterium]|nr:MAG: tetratricopeptide repeat protein [Candidatus Aminicenantes bacterium]
MKCPKCNFDNPSDTKFCGECAALLYPSEGISPPHTDTLQASIKELTRGATFARRYEIIEELGKGGMARVYKVFDKKIKEEVALKLLKPEIAADEKTIERFSNELKFARKIVHKNVGRMYDINEEEGTHYITLEYVPGEDLKSFIKRSEQLTVGKAISVAKQVCEGLTEAQRLGVVHRDLKPQNIMIDREGNARIMDFGIARSLKAKGITDEGVIIGTPEYMSPEQVEGEEADHRSDLYSLGVILYEMVTGSVPFKGDTPLSIAVKHKSQTPRDPKELNAQIPDDLSRVILLCMEKDKGKRYQGTKELLSDLIKIEKNIPTTERIFPKRVLKAEKIGKIKWRNLILYGGAAILSILLIMAGIYLFTGRQEAIDSIAVLPFEYEDADPDMEYLGDGITESLINKLSQLPNLTVISRFSVFQYKGKKPNLQEVGQKLNVKAILTGWIAKRRDGLSISVELVDTRDNSVIWGDKYNRKKLADILTVQENISKEIAENLRLRLSGEEKSRLAKRFTENAEAHQAYLKGRFYWNKRTEVGLMQGLDYFKQAIEKDPGYALAYTGIADSYNLLGRYSHLGPNEAMPKAKAAAIKALEIDDELGEAHTSLAFVVRYYDLDWWAACREYKRAIELNPSYATAHHWYAITLSGMERHDEAIKEIKRALELDPLSLIINTNVAWVYYFARKYDRAIEQYKKTLEMEPNFGVARLRLGRAYLQREMFEEAIAEFKKAASLSDESIHMLAALAHGYAVSGRKDDAMKLLDRLKELSKDRYVPSYELAVIYLGLEDKDQALKWLEKAYEERGSYLGYIKVDPNIDGLRSDPRFKELLKRMGLE